jgi:hypothetical protein
VRGHRGAHRCDGLARRAGAIAERAYACRAQRYRCEPAIRIARSNAERDGSAQQRLALASPGTHGSAGGTRSDPGAGGGADTRPAGAADAIASHYTRPDAYPDSGADTCSDGAGGGSVSAVGGRAVPARAGAPAVHLPRRRRLGMTRLDDARYRVCP